MQQLKTFWTEAIDCNFFCFLSTLAANWKNGNAGNRHSLITNHTQYEDGEGDEEVEDSASIIQNQVNIIRINS